MEGFPSSSGGEESTCDAGDWDSNPGSGRFPGEGKGYPLQHFCLENPMDRGEWQGAAHGVSRVGQDLVTKPPPPLHWELGVLTIEPPGKIHFSGFKMESPTVPFLGLPTPENMGCVLSHSVVSRLLRPWGSPGKNTGVGSLLHRIFPTQMDLLNWQVGSLQLVPPGKTRKLEFKHIRIRPGS